MGRKTSTDVTELAYSFKNIIANSLKLI